MKAMRCISSFLHNAKMREKVFYGVISFNLNNPKEIYLCIGDEVKTVGLHKVDVPPEYAASQEGSFVDIALGRFREKPADIFEGAKCQKVVDAIDLSGDRREWVTIEY